MLKKAEAEGKISGVKTQNSSQIQLISQFADDTSISVLVDQPDSVRNLIEILNLFKSPSGLEINWSKSHAYWWSSSRKPTCILKMGLQWAEKGDVSKLLGTPFGLDLQSEDLDNFVTRRIHAKLHQWSSTKFSLAGRALIVKQVLLSSLWFFFSLWGGTVRTLAKIKALLRNYLWSNTEHSTRTRVNWRDGCVKKKAGGLNLIDPQEGTSSLLCKWAILAYLPGTSNLQGMLRNKLWTSSPSKRTKWQSNPL